MKHLFTLIIVFFSLTSFSQESQWFELGTTWTYHHLMALDFFGEEYQSIYSVTEEVVINGTPCKKIERVGLGEENLFNCFAFSGPYYLYESNDSVFFANDYDNTFRLAYDFNAEVGDSWIFAVPVENFVDFTNYEVTVNAIDTEMIDGQSIRSLTLDFEVVSGEEYSSIGYNSLQVLEYMGVKENGFIIPFGDWNVCEGAYDLEIQCFESSSIDYVSPEFGSCVLSVDGVDSEAGAAIYPNPASDRITVQLVASPAHLAGEVESIRITDFSGRMVASYSWRGDLASYAISDLAEGMYIVEIVGDEKRISSQKFIVQH
jgi:hypothetical protein